MRNTYILLKLFKRTSTVMDFPPCSSLCFRGVHVSSILSLSFLVTFSLLISFFCFGLPVSSVFFLFALTPLSPVLSFSLLVSVSQYLSLSFSLSLSLHLSLSPSLSLSLSLHTWVKFFLLNPLKSFEATFHNRSTMLCMTHKYIRMVESRLRPR